MWHLRKQSPTKINMGHSLFALYLNIQIMRTTEWGLQNDRMKDERPKEKEYDVEIEYLTLLAVAYENAIIWRSGDVVF